MRIEYDCIKCESHGVVVYDEYGHIKSIEGDIHEVRPGYETRKPDSKSPEDMYTPARSIICNGCGYDVSYDGTNMQ